MKSLTLNNGVKIPILGFGTYEILPAETKKAVLAAFKDGYRLIDTAQYYNNKREVGDAIRESELKREDVFITTKTMTDGYYETKAGLDESLAKSGLDYFDLVLICCSSVVVISFNSSFAFLYSSTVKLLRSDPFSPHLSSKPCSFKYFGNSSCTACKA